MHHIGKWSHVSNATRQTICETRIITDNVDKKFNRNYLQNENITAGKVDLVVQVLTGINVKLTNDSCLIEMHCPLRVSLVVSLTARCSAAINSKLRQRVVILLRRLCCMLVSCHIFPSADCRFCKMTSYKWHTLKSFKLRVKKMITGYNRYISTSGLLLLAYLEHTVDGGSCRCH